MSVELPGAGSCGGVCLVSTIAADEGKDCCCLNPSIVCCSADSKVLNGAAAELSVVDASVEIPVEAVAVAAVIVLTVAVLAVAMLAVAAVVVVLAVAAVVVLLAVTAAAPPTVFGTKPTLRPRRERVLEEIAGDDIAEKTK